MLSLLDWNRTGNTPTDVIFYYTLEILTKYDFFSGSLTKRQTHEMTCSTGWFCRVEDPITCATLTIICLSYLSQRSPFHIRSASHTKSIALYKHRDSLLYSQHRAKSVALCETLCMPKLVCTVSCCPTPTNLPAG
jgi:hypothetical protein